eukprot:CAMPEP_0169376492 /NCGR_PEP_ID=MMETSP1017-20121227/38695_1 /TAXON_ID=342587 /ORGANISM="Karlodinium micrum, Strain CCMP2283" /LENGTH=119 /DNA_ID=CAMNT_0009475531 /DNA_START=103 /DNA_END=459 /DNA_ORIENTATION=-
MLLTRALFPIRYKRSTAILANPSMFIRPPVKNANGKMSHVFRAQDFSEAFAGEVPVLVSIDASAMITTLAKARSIQTCRTPKRDLAAWLVKMERIIVVRLASKRGKLNVRLPSTSSRVE